jgi:chromosomal replication initiation ATPase DnaA
MIGEISVYAIPGIELGGYDQLFAMKIKKVVEHYFGIENIEKKTRKKEWRKPRQIASHLTKRSTKLSLQAIGEIYDVDHATVLHSITVVENECNTDKAFRKDYDAIVELLKH